jgi:hypothetical protein
MNGSQVDDAPERGRYLNAIALQNAVLCAECDVVSDSPHDMCLVCGKPLAVQHRSHVWRESSAESYGLGSLRDNGNAARSCAELSEATQAPPQGKRLVSYR